ncbi:MAG: hypothetical protein IH949_09045 [Bacteroidetes bacterium]|nr:hypothetical protein [Bacteroidota bacterium]
MNKFIFKILIILIISTTFISVYAQTVFIRPTDQVYDFLDKLSVKKTLYINDETKPFSRKKVAQYLKKINKNKYKLTGLEKRELTYFLEEYNFELKDKRITERYYLSSYQDKFFNFAFSPLGGYAISSIGKNNGHSRFIGIKAFGTYSDWFGAYIHFSDHGEFGDNVDNNRYLTPNTGYAFIGAPNGIEYSDIIGGITFDWKWGNIGLLKDYNQWGHGRFGNLILSNKAASFPHIRLELKPTKWFRFYYIHGWLNSQVIDSSSIRALHPNSLLIDKREEFISKYIVANLFTFNLYDYVDFSVGNSFVYSGRLRPEMFIPFLFYKLLDRDIGQGSVGDGNGQMYFDISLKHFKNFQFYSTLYIDVISIRKSLEGDFHENWLGYTFGTKIVDYPIKNSSINIEYTKVDPWVYEHKDITTTYKHIGYNLGHWIGQNADHIKIQFNYYFMRSLKASIFAERIRKGGLKDIFFAYKTTDIQPFLYSPVRKDYIYGLNITFNPLHDVFLRGKFKYSDISDEDISRTPSFLLGKHFSFNVSLSYGM